MPFEEPSRITMPAIQSLLLVSPDMVGRLGNRGQKNIQYNDMAAKTTYPKQCRIINRALFPPSRK